jgi:tRNA(Ile)-lysidine synthase TilS/MesJ
MWQRRISHIHDESNDDPRYARNALRHKVMPALERHFPGQERFARSAQHAQSAHRLLTELAEQDLASAWTAIARYHQTAQLSQDRSTTCCATGSPRAATHAEHGLAG